MKLNKQIISGGKEIAIAEKALIMVHGRGGAATDILGLATVLNTEDFALLAPQAGGNTWYPYSFMAPQKQNEPGLSSGLDLIKETVLHINEQGIPTERIYLLGFSQGACLTLEYAARHATRYGGIVAFTGGLIGDIINKDNYRGHFKETPTLLTSGDPDPHVLLRRVQESEEIFKNMHAQVHLKIYPGRPHTISQNEIDLANEIIFG